MKTTNFTLPLVAVAFAAAAGAGCAAHDATNSGASHPADPASDATAPLPATSTWTGTATSPDIARRNLSSSIDAARTRWARIGLPDDARRLVALLDLRSTVHGSLDDLDEALHVAEDAVARWPNEADVHVLHAEALAALHRFAPARASLDVAASLGANVRAMERGIDLATGLDVEGVADERLAEARADGGFARWSDAGAALAQAGRFDEADAAFVNALEAYRDVSPYPVAWVQFQRGVVFAEAAGQPEMAVPLYEDAVRLVPSYVAANVHLAEIEFEIGAGDRAIERLERVREAGDPEPDVRLAEYLDDGTRAAEARALAEARYDHLLATHELAFADHGAEFYLAAGDDADRALELALVNLANRSTDRSYQLAVDAALATGDATLACDLLADAGPDRRRAGLVELREQTNCDVMD